eukprot:NODE_1221_length_1205_cov_244.528696.p1 GENE.NODE_1221_length_1205_cov_244.528696~~NODE_1221_length_1205_cov_244.528696.p1  ORF type:complete len:347 (+),score=57.67 NODE_1221_length_1205_cov_244.528696:152-1042(+)
MTAPADRVRALMQAGLGVPLRVPGTGRASASDFASFRHNRPGGLRRAVSHIWRDGGWGGFFRGNGMNCLKIAPDAALQFTVSPAVTRLLSPGGDARGAPLAARIAAGGVAGAVSTTLIYPLELVKMRVTVAAAGKYMRILDCVREMVASGRPGELAIARFYRGYSASLLGAVPYMGVKLGLYSSMCEEYRARHDGACIDSWTDQLAAPAASFAGISIAYPLNLVRTKLQVQGGGGRSLLYLGFLDCLHKTLHHEGWLGLYRGFIPNVMKALPAESILLQVQRRVAEATLAASSAGD